MALDVKPVTDALWELKKAYRRFSNKGSFAAKLQEVEQAIGAVTRELTRIQTELDRMLSQAAASLLKKNAAAFVREIQSRKEEIVSEEASLARARQTRREIESDIHRTFGRTPQEVIDLIKTTEDLKRALAESYNRLEGRLREFQQHRRPRGAKDSFTEDVLKPAYRVAQGVDMIVMDAPKEAMFEYSFFTGGHSVRDGLRGNG